MTPHTPDADVPEYEAPRVESVLTAEELSREIQYAGIGSPIDQDG